MAGVLARRVDWLALLEAIHAVVPDEQRWVEGIWQAAKPVFRTSHGVGFSIIDHSATCSTARYAALAMDGRPIQAQLAEDAGLSQLGVSGFRAYYYPAGLIATHQEIDRGLSPEQLAAPQRVRSASGCSDALGVFSHPKPGRVAVLYAIHDAPIVLSRHDRELLTRVALHIDTAHRLRCAPELVKAVLDADGRILHREKEAPAAALLSRRVARLASAESPLDLLPALLAGKMALVCRRENGKLRYLVVESAPQTQALRAWSAGEIDVVTQAARGLSTKLVGYALGLSPPAVSRLLGSAASKVGTSTRADLVRIAAMLTRDPRASFPDADFTGAQREILALLQVGLSNREIARQRARSVRTIANQVASLLRKTGSASRRELVVRPLG